MINCLFIEGGIFVEYSNKSIDELLLELHKIKERNKEKIRKLEVNEAGYLLLDPTNELDP